MHVFLIFFSIARKDERVKILMHPWRCLLRGLKDRTHKCKDWYFFATFDSLGLVGVPRVWVSIL